MEADYVGDLFVFPLVISVSFQVQMSEAASCRPYIPVLRDEALVASFPGKGCAAVAEHAVCDLGPDVQCENVFKFQASAVSEAAHLFHERHPCRLLEGGEELEGFEVDLGPAQFGVTHEHAFVKRYATVDLGAGIGAVLVADLEVEQSAIESRKWMLCTCLVGCAMALDLAHAGICLHFIIQSE